MTRPGLVRADTIDLQNQDAPTTQDHHSTSLQPSDLGKHQASEIRHVHEERHEEEEHLQDAWSRAHHDGQVNELTDDQLQAHNHENGDSADDSELDDDMLDDRISSSPSIDDGAYPVAASAWPHRSSSLTPPRQTLNCEAIDSPDSSPFVLAPAHLPLSIMSAADSAASPASSLQSSSPFTLSPKHLPLSASPISRHHHHTGEYAGRYHNNHDYDQETDDYDHADLYREPLGTQDEYLDYNYSPDNPVEDLTAIPEEDDEDELDMNGLFFNRRSPTSRTRSPSSWSTVSDASASSVVEDQESQHKHDDDELDLSFYSDDRFVDSGWGGECLRETEDIDFDFVYALHTFVATVEGQANAGKGDTMVLLDDSNSYWWLVRIVKDNSIGYLPAEHIETPTERLARLNKHRNVDLSAAMLGDTPENSKNPLKKAMKRRKAKTVQFTAPTFVEASDYDYSSDEEDDLMPEPLYGNGNQNQHEDAKSAEDKSSSGNDIATTVVEVARAETPDSASPAKDIKAPAEEPLSSPTLVDKTEAAPLKSSRKGTPRNADSFLKDDGAEPLKISLTPNLLRDNSNGSRSLESTGSSMEGLEKTASPPDKSKDDKKKKEKKPGMLSGLFKSKKKDKRNKNSVDEDSDIEKLSSELARQSTSSDSNKGSPIERPTQFSTAEPKSRGKLQKPQVGGANVAPINSQVAAPAPVSISASAPAPAPAPAAPAPLQLPSVASATQRQRDEQSSSGFVAELEGSTVDTPVQPVQRNVESRQPESRTTSETLLGSHTLSSITNKMRHSESQDSIKPKKVKKAKARVELDDFDEISDEEAQAKEVEDGPNDAFMHGTEMVHIPVNLEDESSSPDDHDTNEERGGEESSERTSSPSMIGTPKASLDGPHENEKHTHDVPTSNVLDDDDQTPLASKRQSAVASGSSTPQQPPVNAPVRRAPSPPPRTNSATPSNGSSVRLSPSPASTRSPVSTAGTLNTWSDASLRAWLDGAENDVRDMLVIIHDKSSVVPVTRDHPLMADLFTDESRRLAGLQDELDGLLGNWLARKRSVREVATT